MHKSTLAFFFLGTACGHGGHPMPADITCDAVQTPIDADEMTSLGFSANEALAGIEGEYSLSATDDDENPVTTAEISISQMAGQIHLVEYVHPDSGEPMEDEEDICRTHLAVPMQLDFTTTDDQFDFSADTMLKFTDIDTGTIKTQYELDDNLGTHRPDMSGVDNATYMLDIEASATALLGDLGLMTESSSGGADGFVMAELQSLLRWSNAE